jgi:cold shock CspA family protein
LKGRIVKYFSFRGFGFISPVGSDEEIFFHVSNYPNVFTPDVGVDLEFDLIETHKGREAINIKIDEGGSDDVASANDEPDKVTAVDANPAFVPVGEIKGVGAVTEEKLTNAGYNTADSVASENVQMISEKTGLSEKIVVKIITSARELVNKEK